MKIITAFLMMLTLCSLPSRGNAVPAVADSIYLGGTILTMNDSMPRAKALAVREGVIVKVGNEAEVLQLNGEFTKVVDLQGRTLMPGFIDSHSHLSLVAIKASTAEMSPPPIGAVDSFAQMKSVFKEHIDKTRPEGDQWVVGWGYDHSKLAENRHPTAADLDSISTRHPILLIHFSTHQAVLNSRGLEMMGYTAESPDPAGGVIVRKPGTRAPNGIVEEQAWIPVFLRAVAVTPQQMQTQLGNALDIYASEGFTTVQDGAVTGPETRALVQALHQKNNLRPDVIGFMAEQLLGSADDRLEVGGEYEKGYRTGGVKFVLDGGSPGRSAYLREPYYQQREGELDYRGYPHITDQYQINHSVADYYERNIPVNIHALGDAALDMALTAVAHAEARAGQGDRRTNMIHLQVVGEDQIERMKNLDVTATFQVTHNYYFGDLHLADILGPQRAPRLNPLNSMISAGVNSTIHHDSPVHPVDQMLIVWAAVNRVTLDGVILGENERVSVMDALKASTINAAYQYFEEDKKGSIEVGKQADFVVLDADPNTVDPMTIKDISVVQTIKKDQTIYQNGSGDPDDK